MARKSRKAKNIVAPIEKKYRTAVYYRLSKLDNGTTNKDTIEHQSMIVENYLTKYQDIEIVKKYIENGKTGTNFKRPKFEEMMQDVRNDKIDCIVVKDLSRFGRNYVETSNYLEKIFPFFNIRFISVSEEFDTLTAKRSKAGYIIPLKALLDDLYAKDLSKKVIPVLRKKQEEGYYIGNACYGYLKSKENKGKLVIDPITAPVVKEIFKLRLDGMAYNAIAKELNDRNIICPQRYFYENDILTLKKEPKTRWADFNVKNLLRCELYMGHMVQGIRRQNLSKGLKVINSKDSELIRVYNTHEAIICEDDFRQVQQINKIARDKYLNSIKNKYSENKYVRKLYCSNCHVPMKRKKNKETRTNDSDYRFYCMHKYKTQIETFCDTESVEESHLDEVVLAVIKKHIKLLIDTRILYDKLKVSSEYRNRVSTLNDNLNILLKRKDRNQYLINSLYENYVLNVIDIDEYYYMKNEYEARQVVIDKDIEDINQKLSKLNKSTSSIDRFDKAVRKFKRCRKVTREMIQVFINKIEYTNADNITIKLNFIDEINEISSIAKEMAVIS